MDLFSIFSGNLIECVFKGCCSLFQENNNLNIATLDLKLIPFTIVINFEKFINDYDKYIYIKKEKDKYYLLGKYEDGLIKTYFDELYNIQTILPIEINRKIVEYNPRSFKTISKFYNELSNEFKLTKIRDVKTDYVKNLLINENFKLPKRTENVFSFIYMDLSKLIITNSLYLKSVCEIPNTMKILYNRYMFLDNFSNFKNLTELETPFMENMIIPITVITLSLYSTSKFSDVLKVIPNSVRNLRIKYMYEKGDDILDFQTLNLNSLKIDIDRFRNTKNLGIVTSQNLKIFKLITNKYVKLNISKTLEIIDIDYEPDDFIFNLQEMDNCKELTLFTNVEGIQYPPNLKILNLNIYTYQKEDFTNTKLEKLYIRRDMSQNKVNNLIKNTKFPKSFQTIELEKNTNDDNITGVIYVEKYKESLESKFKEMFYE